MNKTLPNPFLARRLRHMKCHVCDFQHVSAAHAVPGVHHAVMAEGDIHARGPSLGMWAMPQR